MQQIGFHISTTSMKIIRQILATVLGLICFCVFVSSCSGTSKTSVRAPADGSQYGGEVIVGITQEPSIFDPHTVVAAGDEEILFNIFEGLVKCDSNGNFVPALATDFFITENATDYIFTIRQDVKFHNGNTLSVEDVIYSLSRAAGLYTGRPLQSDLAGIESVTQTGEYQVTVHLTAPDAEMMPFFTVAIIPKDIPDIQATPIGTGPFVFSSYRVGESIILTRNNEYWQSNLPYLDKVTFKITADMDSAFLELKSGNIDIFPYLTLNKADQIRDTYQILSRESNMVQIFALNNAITPLNDPLVREAINCAINRENLISLSMDGAGVPLYSGMSPAMGKYYDSSLDNSIPYNILRAKELLADAGYPDGLSLSVVVPSNYQIHVDTAVILSDQLSKAGIDLSIVTVDWSTWLNDVYQGKNFETTVIALTSDFTPRDVLSRYVTDADGNFISYSNPDFDRIFSQIASESDETLRVEMYHDLLAILLQDYASAYLQDPQNIVAVKKDLSGYVVYPIYVQDMSLVQYN